MCMRGCVWVKCEGVCELCEGVSEMCARLCVGQAVYEMCAVCVGV